ncbi:MAG: hypothetical protein ACXWC9_05540, partial [Pseudobdellovibrionaceae bacterium]
SFWPRWPEGSPHMDGRPTVLPNTAMTNKLPIQQFIASRMSEPSAEKMCAGSVVKPFWVVPRLSLELLDFEIFHPKRFNLVPKSESTWYEL